MTIHWKAIEQYFAVMLQSQPRILEAFNSATCERKCENSLLELIASVEKRLEIFTAQNNWFFSGSKPCHFEGARGDWQGERGAEPEKGRRETRKGPRPRGERDGIGKRRGRWVKGRVNGLGTEFTRLTSITVLMFCAPWKHMKYMGSASNLSAQY